MSVRKKLMCPIELKSYLVSFGFPIGVEMY
jgi:hypothetical protein